MGKVMIIGCGGVASVAIHKCCQNSDVFTELCIASRTVSKCDALKKKLDGSVNAYYLRYDAAFDEDGNAVMHFFRERIVKRECGFVWQGRVHETLCVAPPVRCEAGIAVTHKRGGARKERGRNLFIFARMFADGTMPDDRQKYYFARELCDNGLYETAAAAFEWFLRGGGCRLSRFSENSALQ